MFRQTHLKGLCGVVFLLAACASAGGGVTPPGGGVTPPGGGVPGGQSTPRLPRF